MAVHESPASVSEAQALESTPPAPTTSSDVQREGPNAGRTEAQPASALTDGQILQVVHTANLGEVEQAKVALSKTKDARVRKLAQAMVRDHTQADKKGMALAKKANLEREPSPASESIASDADGVTRSLRAEPGPDFDRDYVDAQIREHQSVLAVLDQKLAAGMTSDELKTYLAEVRAAVAAHLQHAQELRQEMLSAQR